MVGSSRVRCSLPIRTAEPSRTPQLAEEAVVQRGEARVAALGQAHEARAGQLLAGAHVPGDIVAATGTLALDRDFGAGYRYGVIVEGATLSK